MADPAWVVTDDPDPRSRFHDRANRMIVKMRRPHVSDENYHAMGELVTALCRNAGVEPHALGLFNGHQDVSWHLSLMTIWDKDAEEAERALIAIQLAFG